MTVETEINKLASHVAKEASKEGTDSPPFQEKIDALKTLTAYYAILTKKNGKAPAEEDDAPSFHNFATELKNMESENGRKTSVRGDRGRSKLD